MRGSLGPAKRAALNVMGREISDIVGCAVFSQMFAWKKRIHERPRKEMGEGEDERLIDRKG